MSDRTHAWPNGARGAVSLTYDDALACHREEVAPALAAQGLAGTFYMCNSPDFRTAPRAWGAVAAAGHELGNHSLFHACRSQAGKRIEWLDAAYDLRDYTPRRWTDEMECMNQLLHLVDGRTERTFGRPCGSTHIGPDEMAVDVAELGASLFAGMRGGAGAGLADPGNLDPMRLPRIFGDGRSFEELSESVEAAAQEGRWAILVFHGVGEGTHAHYVKAEAHRRLTEHLAARADAVWTAPVIDVIRRLRG